MLTAGGVSRRAGGVDGAGRATGGAGTAAGGGGDAAGAREADEFVEEPTAGAGAGFGGGVAGIDARSGCAVVSGAGVGAEAGGGAVFAGGAAGRAAGPEMPRLGWVVARGSAAGVTGLGATMDCDARACGVAGALGATTASRRADARGLPKSSWMDAPAAIVITPPHTEQRARIDDDGTLLGSTRKTERHSGQETFTIPPWRQADWAEPH